MALRNGNGSQFIVNAVRQYLKDKNACQAFSHVATPEDNAYIEALHLVQLKSEGMARLQEEHLKSSGTNTLIQSL